MTFNLDELLRSCGIQPEDVGSKPFPRFNFYQGLDAIEFLESGEAGVAERQHGSHIVLIRSHEDPRKIIGVRIENVSKLLTPKSPPANRC